MPYMMANNLGQQITDLGKGYEQLKLSTITKPNTLKDHIEDTRRDLLGLLKDNTIDTSDRKSLKELSKKIDEVIKSPHIQGKSTTHKTPILLTDLLDKQKDAIDKVRELLKNINAKCKGTDIAIDPNINYNLDLGSNLDITTPQGAVSPLITITGTKASNVRMAKILHNTAHLGEEYQVTIQGADAGMVKIVGDKITFTPTAGYTLNDDIVIDLSLTYQPSLPIASIQEKTKATTPPVPVIGSMTHSKTLTIKKGVTTAPTSASTITAKLVKIFDDLDKGKKLELTDKHGGRFTVYKEGSVYYAASLDDETPRAQMSEADIIAAFGFVSTTAGATVAPTPPATTTTVPTTTIGTPTGPSGMSGGPSGTLGGPSGLSTGPSGMSMGRVYSSASREIATTFSDMDTAVKDQGRERHRNEQAERFQTKGRWGRLKEGARQSLMGNMFNKNSNKHRDAVKAEKGGLKMNGERAATAEGHAHQEIIDRQTGFKGWIQKIRGGSKIERILTLTESSTEYSLVYDQIHTLAYQFYRAEPTLTEAAFTTKIEDLLTPNGVYAAAHPAYQTQITAMIQVLSKAGLTINDCGADIVNMCKIQQGENRLKREQAEAVRSITPPPPPTPAQLSDYVRQSVSRFTRFAQVYKIVPQLFGDINNTLSGGVSGSVSGGISGGVSGGYNSIHTNDTYESIAEKCRVHYTALMHIGAQSDTERVKMKVQFLKNGRSADHVDAKNQSIKWRNPVAKISEYMSGSRYWGVRMLRYPLNTVAAIGIGALAAQGAGAIGAGVVAAKAIGIGLGALKAGALAAGKKSSDLKKTHESRLKDYIKDRSKHEANFAADPRLKFVNNYINSFGRYEGIEEHFTRLMSKAILTPAEQELLIDITSLITAGFDYQQRTGLPGFSIETNHGPSGGPSGPSGGPSGPSGGPSGLSGGGSNLNQRYAESMRNLRRFRDSGLARISQLRGPMDEAQLRGTANYTDYHNGYNGQYNEFAKSYNKHRRRETTKSGARAAAIFATVAGGAALLGGAIGTGNGSGTEQYHGTPSPNSQLDDTGYNGIYKGTEPLHPDNISSSPLRDPNGMIDRNYTYDPGEFHEEKLFTENFDRDLRSIVSDHDVVKPGAIFHLKFAGSTDALHASPIKYEGQLNDMISDIKAKLATPGLNPDTVKNINDIIAKPNIDHMIAEAQKAGATDGNMYLGPTRGLEAVNQSLDELIHSGQASSLILKPEFDPSLINTQSISGGSVGNTFRNFECNLSIFNPKSPVSDIDYQPGTTSYGPYTEDTTHKKFRSDGTPYRA